MKNSIVLTFFSKFSEFFGKLKSQRGRFPRLPRSGKSPLGVWGATAEKTQQILPIDGAIGGTCDITEKTQQEYFS